MKKLLLLVAALLSAPAFSQQMDKPNPFKPATSGTAAPSAPVPPSITTSTPSLPTQVEGSHATIVKHIGKVNGVNVYEDDQQQFVFSKEPLSVAPTMPAMGVAPNMTGSPLPPSPNSAGIQKK